MTDYFALFQEARRPWLDPDKLKEKYFDRAREAAADAELNEAFRILGDPKLRLQHLLLLEGVDLRERREIPAALAELFWNTGTLLREFDRWRLRNANAHSALARAILRGERAKLEHSLEEHEAKLKAAFESELHRLQTLSAADWPNELEKLIQLHDSIAYLTRLRDQVKEKRLQLNNETAE